MNIKQAAKILGRRGGAAGFGNSKKRPITQYADMAKLRWANKETIEARFWRKVDKKSEDECWEWTANMYPSGYGMFCPCDGRTITASRMSWIITHGKIPDGLKVLHKCDNPKCVNPKHLFTGTDKDNYHDSAKKGRRPHLIGDLSGNHKLTEKDVKVIKRRFEAGDSNQDIARDYNMHPGTIRGIRVGRNWSHV